MDNGVVPLSTAAVSAVEVKLGSDVPAAVPVLPSPPGVAVVGRDSEEAVEVEVGADVATTTTGPVGSPVSSGAAELVPREPTRLIYY